jgi:hypothetical protein
MMRRSAFIAQTVEANSNICLGLVHSLFLEKAPALSSEYLLMEHILELPMRMVHHGRPNHVPLSNLVAEPVVESASV